MILFDNVSLSYDGKELLRNISLELMSGGFYFLTGPSGAGKTTFIKLAYGGLSPTTGKIKIFNQQISQMSRDEAALNRRRVGIVHQDCQFLNHLSLAANVALPLTVSGLPTSQKNLQELLRWVGLSSRENALPPTLSGGELQRATLARAVITNPDIILADEPTGNLDWDMSLRLMTLLVELNKMGKTVVIATHDLNMIRQVKSHLNARVLRIQNKNVQLAKTDL